MKTSELTGAALDWAVAKCEGIKNRVEDGMVWELPLQEWDYAPSTDWAQGGPIIEREKITISYMSNAPLWVAHGTGRVLPNIGGPTPLIAAMRAFVASKLGDEVEIPEGLK